MISFDGDKDGEEVMNKKNIEMKRRGEKEQRKLPGGQGGLQKLPAWKGTRRGYGNHVSIW